MCLQKYISVYVYIYICTDHHTSLFLLQGLGGSAHSFFLSLFLLLSCFLSLGHGSKLPRITRDIESTALTFTGPRSASVFDNRLRVPIDSKALYSLSLLLLLLLILLLPPSYSARFGGPPTLSLSLSLSLFYLQGVVCFGIRCRIEPFSEPRPAGPAGTKLFFKVVQGFAERNPWKRNRNIQAPRPCWFSACSWLHVSVISDCDSE